jgi:hypothetical protein
MTEPENTAARLSGSDASETPGAQDTEPTEAPESTHLGVGVPVVDSAAPLVRTPTKPRSEISAAPEQRTSVRDLLAGYDQEVETVLSEAFATETGTERVQLLHRVRSVIAVHDAVLRHALCPMLEELPGGRPVAERLCIGVDERVELLRRFDKLTKGVTPRNVYVGSGPEIEEILVSLDESMTHHIDVETHEVGDVLEASESSVDPEVVSARMALEAHKAPTRIHRSAGSQHRSQRSATMLRLRDRLADWSDAHHGWTDTSAVIQSPRQIQVQELKRRAGSGQPSVRDVLGSYDQTVNILIDEWEAAPTVEERIVTAHRLNAAVTVHDSVLGGVLCPLLDSIPEGKGPAEELREGCETRAELQRTWLTLAKDRDDTAGRDERLRVMASLVESFRAHEEMETTEVTRLVEQLSDDSFRTKSSLLADIAWPWHSDGPALLALRMAMWADASPTRSHRLLSKHPTSRALRSMYRTVDHVSDFWPDTPFERWLKPQRSSAPYSKRTTTRHAPGPSATQAPGSATEHRSGSTTENTENHTD